MNPLSAKDQHLARETAAAAKEKAPPLNPKFPYKAKPFAPAAFGVLADPPPAVDSPAPPQT